MLGTPLTAVFACPRQCTLCDQPKAVYILCQLKCSDCLQLTENVLCQPTQCFEHPVPADVLRLPAVKRQRNLCD